MHLLSQSGNYLQSTLHVDLCKMMKNKLLTGQMLMPGEMRPDPQTWSLYQRSLGRRESKEGGEEKNKGR